MTGHETTVAGPRFIDTALELLSDDNDMSTRETAELIVEARRVLRRAVDRLLGSKDPEDMERILNESTPDVAVAMDVITNGARLTEDTPRQHPWVPLLRKLRGRGVGDSIVERVRLALVAVDDEVRMLRWLPGGLDAHPEIENEHRRAFFLAVSIAAWAHSDNEEPHVWESLTFAFLDSASRAFGLASAAINEAHPLWPSEVA